MIVEAFVLCDAATEQNGKLNILGAFDKIWVKKIPVKHRRFEVATRLRCLKAGIRSIKIIFTNPDGKFIGPKLEGNIDFAKDNGVGNVILTCYGIEFEKLGKYKVDLLIDNKVVASNPLHITKLTQENKK